MTAETDLLLLPEWTKRDDLDGLLPSEVRVEMLTYLRANMGPLRQKLRRLTFELDAATIYGNERGTHYQQCRSPRRARECGGTLDVPRLNDTAAHHRRTYWRR